MDGSVIVVSAVKRNALDRMTESMPPSSSKAGRPGYRCRWDAVTIDVARRMGTRPPAPARLQRRGGPSLRSATRSCTSLPALTTFSSAHAVRRISSTGARLHRPGLGRPGLPAVTARSRRRRSRGDLRRITRSAKPPNRSGLMRSLSRWPATGPTRHPFRDWHMPRTCVIGASTHDERRSAGSSAAGRKIVQHDDLLRRAPGSLHRRLSRSVATWENVVKIITCMLRDLLTYSCLQWHRAACDCRGNEKRKPRSLGVFAGQKNAPGMIRTCDTRFRTAITESPAQLV